MLTRGALFVALTASLCSAAAACTTRSTSVRFSAAQWRSELSVAAAAQPREIRFTNFPRETRLEVLDPALGQFLRAFEREGGRTIRKTLPGNEGVGGVQTLWSWVVGALPTVDPLARSLARRYVLTAFVREIRTRRAVYSYVQELRFSCGRS